MNLPVHTRIPVGVVVERRKAQSPWIDFVWKPATVLAGLPDAAPWTVLASDEDGATFYAGPAAIDLYRTETTNYRDNLAGPARRCSGSRCGRPESSRPTTSWR